MDDSLMVFIDVSSVPELHMQSVSNEIILGGNVSLTQTIDIMNSVAKTPGFEYCRYIADHIDLVANVPVRNVGYYLYLMLLICYANGTFAYRLAPWPVISALNMLTTNFHQIFLPFWKDVELN